MLAVRDRDVVEVDLRELGGVGIDGRAGKGEIEARLARRRVAQHLVGDGDVVLDVALQLQAERRRQPEGARVGVAGDGGLVGAVQQVLLKVKVMEVQRSKIRALG